MLKGLMISKKIEQRKADLAALVEQETALKTREAELEAAIDEAKTDEELAVVEENSNKLDGDKKELEEKKSKLEGEIAALEGELQQLNSKDPSISSTPPASGQERHEIKGGEVRMKRGFFRDMNRSEAEGLVARSEVKEFVDHVRGLIGQKRAVTGADLTIPDVLLSILRDNLHRYSKLISKVFLKPVAGTARQTIAGAIPEGIWTEMVGTLNELSIVFNQLEVDGYKVGGFVAIPNSIIEDSDLNLASEVLDAIGQAIGLALDKAILYGTGTKMPVGIVKRLAETAQPSYWGAREKAWTNLSAINLLVISQTATGPVDFFADLILKLGIVKANYSNGSKFWAMNSQTLAALQAKALGFNAAGAIVSGMQNTFPIVGGDVVILDFIPVGHIIGGYGSLYLLAERAGAQFAQSEHAQFIQDNTVFKGTARYDGRPVFGEAFVAINITQGGTPAAPAPGNVTFAADTANG